MVDLTGGESEYQIEENISIQEAEDKIKQK